MRRAMEDAKKASKASCGECHGSLRGSRHAWAAAMELFRLFLMAFHLPGALAKVDRRRTLRREGGRDTMCPSSTDFQLGVCIPSLAVLEVEAVPPLRLRAILEVKDTNAQDERHHSAIGRCRGRVIPQIPPVSNEDSSDRMSDANSRRRQQSR